MGEPSRSVLICATPRSGSYLLCEALRLTGRGGMPEEYLWRPNAVRFAREWGVDVDDTDAFRTALLRNGSTPNGVFGCKVMWGYVATAARVLRGEPWGADDDHAPERAGGLVDALPNTTFVFMRRRDTVGQAISYSRATQADAWAQLGDGSEVPGAAPVLDDATSVRRRRESRAELSYDYHQIEFFRQEIEAHNDAWETFFASHGVTPIIVAYEDLASDFEGVAVDLLDRIGADTSEIEFGERKLQRQRDHVSRRWRLRYEEDTATHAIAAGLEAR